MGKPKPSKQTTKSTTVSTPTPWAPAADALSGMVSSAQKAYDATPKTPIFTGPNSDQLAAQNMLRAYAPQASAGAGAMRGIADKVSSGFYLDPTNNLAMQGSGWNEDINPALQGMIKAAINPLHDQLEQNALSIGDAANLAGAYGGDRGQLLKGQALSRFDRDAMDVGSMYYGQAYENMTGRKFSANQNDFNVRANAFENERQRQMQGASLYNDANQLDMGSAKILAALGDQTAGWDVAKATAAMDAPWAGLDRLTSVLGTTAPYASRTETGDMTTTGTMGGGGLAGGLSGAIGGASAGSAFGPWGAGIGAIAGGLGGLFG